MRLFTPARYDGLPGRAFPGSPDRYPSRDEVVDYLTAYAHNREILVKEGQSVTRGQKIAEMGSTDADRVKLHFEIRRLGKPMDPLRYLPPA